MDEPHEGSAKQPLRHFCLFGGPVIAYAALIYFLSSLSHFGDEIQIFSCFDKIAHLMEYLLFGFLICRWFSSLGPGRKKSAALIMTMVLGTFYGLLDEWHQSFVPGRDASLGDAFFDAAGVTAGAFLYRWLQERRLLSTAPLKGRG